MARTSLGRKACFVHVYFANHATHEQEKLAGTKLRGDSRVKQIAFTSKAQALAEFKKRFPKIAGAAKLPENPLPDSYTVVPVRVSETGELERSIMQSHWPGVATVMLDPCKRPKR